MNKKERCKLLIKSYHDEYRKNSHYLSLSKEESLSTIIRLSTILYPIDFNKALVEFTQEGAIRFTFLCKENIILLITIPTETDISWGDANMVYSVSINKELLVCDADILKEFVPKFVEYLNQY